MPDTPTNRPDDLKDETFVRNAARAREVNERKQQARCCGNPTVLACDNQSKAGVAEVVVTRDHTDAYRTTAAHRGDLDLPDGVTLAGAFVRATKPSTD